MEEKRKFFSFYNINGKGEKVYRFPLLNGPTFNDEEFGEKFESVLDNAFDSNGYDLEGKYGVHDISGEAADVWAYGT